MDVNIGAERYPDVEDILEGLEEISGGVVAFDATMLALETGNERTMNVVLLGALAATKKLPFDEEHLREAIRERVPPRTIETNKNAYAKGFQKSKEILRNL
jgi:indolepyruvate ferredoxin oxidoreductase beta subunit